MSAGEVEFELVEEYELLGEKRYRLRVRGTNVVVNVAAENMDEAVEKARELLRDIGAERAIRETFFKSRGA